MGQPHGGLAAAGRPLSASEAVPEMNKWGSLEAAPVHRPALSPPAL
jgi:hypothetical protein